MKLVATVQRDVGATSHTVCGAELPRARRVEIEGRAGEYFLIRYGERNEFAGDTWHQTIEEAKGQAKFEFGIEDDARQETTD